MKRIVLFDVKRLLARFDAGTPTGIDRVDLAYLDHFLQDPQCLVLGISLRGDKMKTYRPAMMRWIRDVLTARWSGGQGVTRAERVRLRAYKIANRAHGAVSWLLSMGDRRQTPGHLVRVAQRHPEALVLYVNCSHGGAGRRGQALLEALKQDVRAKHIYYVHDTIPIDFPQFSLDGHPERHVERMKMTARNADMILTNSQYSGDSFVAFATAQGFSVPKPVVLWIGVEPAFLKAASAARPRDDGGLPYFVVIGTIEPRKNHLLLLETWKRLIADGGPVPQLRIIGRRGWTTAENARYDDEVKRLAPHVVETGPLSDSEMIANLLGARALLFPSFTEGWGMPLVEALAAGIPAIVSDIPAFAEATQGLTPRLDPRYPEAWAAMVRRYADAGDPTRAAAVAALADFVIPTWQKQFADFEAALDQTFGQAAPSGAAGDRLG